MGNIRIRVNFYFLAVISYIVIIDTTQIMLIGVISTFIHEIGHIIAMILKNHKIREINIGFFYIDIVDKDRKIINYENDLFILISGSALNYIISVISLFMFCFTKNYIFQNIIYINSTIGAVNLLPIASLDGGQIVFIVLNRLFCFKTANILYNTISIIFLIPLAFVGFIVLLKSKYNFSLLFICCYLIYTLLLKNENNYL